MARRYSVTEKDKGSGKEREEDENIQDEKERRKGMIHMIYFCNMWTWNSMMKGDSEKLFLDQNAAYFSSKYVSHDHSQSSRYFCNYY